MCKYVSDSKWEYCVEIINVSDKTIIIKGVLVAVSESRAAIFDGTSTKQYF